MGACYTAASTTTPPRQEEVPQQPSIDMAPRNYSSASTASDPTAATSPREAQPPQPRQKENPVLVVGAGPVGLSCALALARQNVAVRIIDRAEHPTPHHESRAMVLWRRTLQTLDPYVPHERFAKGHVRLRTMTILRGGGGDVNGGGEGVADKTTTREAAGAGSARAPQRAGTRGAGAHAMGSVVFDGPDGDPDRRRRLPPAVLLPQADTERLLTEALAAEGVRVERGVELCAAKRVGEVTVPKKTKNATRENNASAAPGATACVYGDGGDTSWGLDDEAAASVMQVDADVDDMNLGEVEEAAGFLDDDAADDEELTREEAQVLKDILLCDTDSDDQEEDSNDFNDSNDSNDSNEDDAADKVGERDARARSRREEVRLDFVDGGGGALENERVRCTLRRTSASDGGKRKSNQGNVGRATAAGGRAARADDEEAKGEYARDEEGDTEEMVTPWLIGCDGAGSTVRRIIGADFPGETIPDKWLLADLVLEPRESTPPISSFGGGVDDESRGWTSSFCGVGGGGDNPDVDMQPSVTLDAERGPVALLPISTFPSIPQWRIVARRRGPPGIASTLTRSSSSFPSPSRTSSSSSSSSSSSAAAQAVDSDKMTDLYQDLEDAFNRCWLSRGWKLRGGVYTGVDSAADPSVD